MSIKEKLKNIFKPIDDISYGIQGGSVNKPVKRVPENRLAESFNILYQEFVNEKKEPDQTTLKYKEAREFVSEYHSKLDTAVLEFLTMYITFSPEGRINFAQGVGDSLTLDCYEGKNVRSLGFSEDGVIVRDEKFELTSKKPEPPVQPSEKGE